MGGVHIAEALRIPYFRAFTVSPTLMSVSLALTPPFTSDAMDSNTGISSWLLSCLYEQISTVCM